MLQFASGGSNLNVQWTVFSGDELRAGEAQKSAEAWLEGVHESKIQLHDFRDGYFPAAWEEIKQAFEQIKTDFDPDIIFTHTGADLHQDHRVINELTWNTFRNHFILEYEIPKYDGDLRTPNCYVPLTTEAAKKKSASLIRHFQSQGDKHWFCEELFLGLMRIRGMEAHSPSGYAEGFYARKICCRIQ